MSGHYYYKQKKYFRNNFKYSFIIEGKKRRKECRLERDRNFTGGKGGREGMEEGSRREGLNRGMNVRGEERAQPTF